MEVEAAIDSAARSVGLQALKPTQREAIRMFASGRDVFVALHTGHAKSFCFVLLPLVFDRILGCSGSIALCVSFLTCLVMAVGEVWATLHIVYSSMSSYLRNLPNLHTAATSYKVLITFQDPLVIFHYPRPFFSLPLPPRMRRSLRLRKGLGTRLTETVIWR